MCYRSSRKERDSNSRYPFEYDRFQIDCFRPTQPSFPGATRGSQTHLILITSEVRDRYARVAKSCFQWEG